MDDHLLSWCKRLIGCRSVTSEGTRVIAELCARELLAPLGIVAQILPAQTAGESQVNLIATVIGNDHCIAPLVLNTHLDTVPPGPVEFWTQCAGDPWNATVVDDRIYGLGAADTKLDFLAKAIALASGTPRRDVTLVATFGEEQGLLGAKEMAASGLLPRGALAFIGEPSRLEVITAHKGLMAFTLKIGFAATPRLDLNAKFRRVVFEGRAAHSSTPALGRNAIVMALEAVTGQTDWSVVAINGGDAINKVSARCEVIVLDRGERKADDGSTDEVHPSSRVRLPHEALIIVRRFVERLQQFADQAGSAEEGYAPPTLTCNPGVIRSTPDSLTLEFELRPPPGLALELVRDGVAAIVLGLQQDVAEMRLELHEGRANPGFRSQLHGETVELALGGLARAGLPLSTNVKAGCTEAGIYAAAGLQPIVFGPGPSTGVIHSPNEYNFVSEVAGAIRFYTALLSS